MDIIISANEKILSLTQENKLTVGMSKDQFTIWLNQVVKIGSEDEPEVQKVSI